MILSLCDILRVLSETWARQSRFDLDGQLLRSHVVPMESDFVGLGTERTMRSTLKHYRQYLFFTNCEHSIITTVYWSPSTMDIGFSLLREENTVGYSILYFCPFVRANVLNLAKKLKPALWLIFSLSQYHRHWVLCDVVLDHETMSGRKEDLVDSSIATICSVCAVSPERARELLEASSGSLERAIEIHLSSNRSSSDTTLLHSVCVVAQTTTPNKRPRKGDTISLEKPTVLYTDRKQATLDAFVGSTTVPPPSQRRVGDYFAPKQTKVTEKDHNNRGDQSAFEETENESKDTSEGIMFQLLATTFASMANTSKRNEKLDILSNMFRTVITNLGGIHENRSERENIRCTEQLVAVIDLVCGRISSTNRDEHSNNVKPLQVSWGAVSQSLRIVTGLSRNTIRHSYRKSGDLGDVAAEFFGQKSVETYFGCREKRSPTVTTVYSSLVSIANVQAGQGSSKVRENLLVKLMRSMTTKDEIRFLVRILLGNMRIGATTKTILTSIGKAAHSIKPAPVDDVNKVMQDIFHICPRYDVIASALLSGGLEKALQDCRLSIGFPVLPMLANPARSIDQIKDFMNKSDHEIPITAEYKYDGMRCQAHFDGKTVKLFSRHLHDFSDQYPDVVKNIEEAKVEGVNSFIIDSEIVAVTESVENGVRGFCLLPFQDLTSYRRSLSSQYAKKESCRVRVYAFDLLYRNGEDLLGFDLEDRQKILRECFLESDNFTFASALRIPSFDSANLEKFLNRAIKDGAEGLMIKLLGNASQPAPYQAGSRGTTWLKLKRDYIGEYADTIDVVPIGAWYGNGRKAQRGFLSPVLLAVYDPDEECFQSICRCMSFTDAMYKGELCCDYP